MSSRSVILNKIKAAKPEHIPLPVIDQNYFTDDSGPVERFKTMLEAVGGKILNGTNTDIHKETLSLFKEASMRFSTLEGSERFNTLNIGRIKRPHELESLDLLILKAQLAVAENGAVWLQDAEIPVRVLPFITKHLVIKVSEKDIVPTMHQAYKKIAANDFDFGLFLSGPSKTADIEQALVIGAQGALDVLIFLEA